MSSSCMDETRLPTARLRTARCRSCVRAETAKRSQERSGWKRTQRTLPTEGRGKARAVERKRAIVFESWWGEMRPFSKGTSGWTSVWLLDCGIFVSSPLASCSSFDYWEGAEETEAMPTLAPAPQTQR